MNTKKTIVVVPVYNEADIIRRTIEGLKEIEEIDEILIVDDGSTDNTAKILQEMNVSILTVPENKGKGYAMKLAAKESTYDYIAFVDGDLGYTSRQIIKLIEPVILNEADFTVAKFEANKTKGGFGLVKGLAKIGVSFYTGKKTDVSLSGQRVYKKDVIDSIKYMPNNYGVEVAMTIQAINKGYRFIEVPVDMSHRHYDRSIKGFKHRGKQFLDIIKTLLHISFGR